MRVIKDTFGYQKDGWTSISLLSYSLCLWFSMAVVDDNAGRAGTPRPGPRHLTRHLNRGCSENYFFPPISLSVGTFF